MLEARRPSFAEESEHTLVHRLALALRTAELYQSGNEALTAVLDQLHEHLTTGGEWPDGVEITARAGCFFIQDERVRVRQADYQNQRYLLGLFDAWGVGSLRFAPQIEADELQSLLECLLGDEARGLDRLEEQLRQRRIVHVDVLPPFEGGGGGASGADAGGVGLPLRAYAACLEVSQDLYDAIRESRPLQTRRLRRVTQSIVDLLLRDESVLLNLTTIKRFDDYLFRHSTNVAILAVALGQRLGLSKTRLGDLCVAAFLHDLGKVAIAKELLEKPEGLTADEWEQMREHPIHGVHLVLGQRHLNNSMLQAVVVGFEHHLNHDLTGYPGLCHKTSISLFGRIVAIADRYDAMTTTRSYRPSTFTPHEAIQHLVNVAGTQLDPGLVRVFVSLLGVYPPGTVVGLSSGALAVVTRTPNEGSPSDRPQVRILRGRGTGDTVDLAQMDPQGDYVDEVQAVYDPNGEGLLPLGDLEPT